MTRREEIQAVLDSSDGLPTERFVADAIRALMPVGAHPVLERIRRRRHAVLMRWEPEPGGDAAEQTITVGEAYALHEHFAELRAQRMRTAGQRFADSPEADAFAAFGEYATLPELGPIIPGEYWPSCTACACTSRARPRAVTETRGGRGTVGMAAIACQLVPDGTRPDRRTFQYIRPDHHGPAAIEWMKGALGVALREPHVLAALGQEDFLPDESPLPRTWRALCGITFRAIPGKTLYIVMRPAPSAEDWLPLRLNGRWQKRPSGAGPMNLAVHHGLEATVATARPTGRVEVRDDGAVAEVYEVSA